VRGDAVTLAQRYLAGESLREIAESIGSNRETVRLVLKDSGVSLRRRCKPVAGRLGQKVLGRIGSEPVTLAQLCEQHARDPKDMMRAVQALLRHGKLALTIAEER
jgi:hypothetical protein